MSRNRAHAESPQIHADVHARDCWGVTPVEVASANRRRDTTVGTRGIGPQDVLTTDLESRDVALVAKYRHDIEVQCGIQGKDRSQLLNCLQ